MTAKRETIQKRGRMIERCHICSSSAPGARPLEDNTYAWQSPAHHSTQHPGQQGRNENKKMKEGRQKIQMKEEIRRSNCDKGVEKRNYRVKESRKREKENVMWNMMLPEATAVGLRCCDTLRDIQGGQAG